MATIKVACPKCGQKVSGDESFYGSTVECPICSSDIFFPGQKRPPANVGFPLPVPPDTNGKLSGSGESSPEITHIPPDAVTHSLSAEEVYDFRDEGPIASRPIPPTGEDHEDDLLPPSPIYGAISIVSAVLSVVTACVLGGVLFAPIAIIFGHTALAKARHSPVQPAPGHTLGAIGLMIGYVSLVITILVLLTATFFTEEIRAALQNLQWRSAS